MWRVCVALALACQHAAPAPAPRPRHVERAPEVDEPVTAPDDPAPAMHPYMKQLARDAIAKWDAPSTDIDAIGCVQLALDGTIVDTKLRPSGSADVDASVRAALDRARRERARAPQPVPAELAAATKRWLCFRFRSGHAAVKAPAAPPSPPPSAPTCEQVADHVLASLTKDGPMPQDLHDRVRAVIVRHCVDDGWSDAARACIVAADLSADTNTCEQLLTKQQQDQLRQEMWTLVP
jgi:hypothetical protein